MNCAHLLFLIIVCVISNPYIITSSSDSTSCVWFISLTGCLFCSLYLLTVKKNTNVGTSQVATFIKT